jgi:hypothetical protein
LHFCDNLACHFNYFHSDYNSGFHHDPDLGSLVLLGKRSAGQVWNAIVHSQFRLRSDADLAHSGFHHADFLCEPGRVCDRVDFRLGYVRSSLSQFEALPSHSALGDNDIQYLSDSVVQGNETQFPEEL